MAEHNPTEAEREEALRKIQKLLRMTEERGASQNEAETAARIARKMLDRYQLTMAEIAARQREGEIGERIVEQAVWRGENAWSGSLAGMLGAVFKCRVIGLPPIEGMQIWQFVGHESDVAVSGYFYFFLLGELTRHGKASAASHRIRKGRATDNYVTAFAQAAISILQERFAEGRAEATSAEANALVTLDQAKVQAVNRYVSEKWPDLRRGRASYGPRDLRAENAGRKLGESISLQRPISSSGASAPAQLEHRSR